MYWSRNLLEAIGQVEIILEFLEVYFAIRCEGRKPLFIDGFGDFRLEFPFVFDIVNHPSFLPLAKADGIEHDSNDRLDSTGITLDFCLMNHETAGREIHRQFI